MPPSSARGRKTKAHALNPVVDQALLRSSPAARRALLRLADDWDTADLAERLRRRATTLARRRAAPTPAILRERDGLILALYARAAPPGWSSAWCDGSAARGPAGRSARVGGLLLNSAGRVLSRISRAHAACDPFEAEIAALAAILQAARRQRVARLRVHTDCVALARLWYGQRDDPRLAAVHALARAFRRLDLRAVPREHNQPAHALARRAPG